MLFGHLFVKEQQPDLFHLECHSDSVILNDILPPFFFYFLAHVLNYYYGIGFGVGEDYVHNLTPKSRVCYVYELRNGATVQNIPDGFDYIGCNILNIGDFLKVAAYIFLAGVWKINGNYL